MNWLVKYLPEAMQDLKDMDGSQRILVRKAINKVQKNPLPQPDGYGVPLGNKGGADLAGFLKIKLRGAGLRIVYKFEIKDDLMLIIVIGMRKDDEVYKKADERIKSNNL